MQPFPQEANTPPVVGEYAYYHAQKNKYFPYTNKFMNPHWICKLTLPDGSIVEGRAVHYSLPEAKGSAPFISQHEGVISEITLCVNNQSKNKLND